MNTMADQIDALSDMTTGELAQRYRELHGQPVRTRHRAYLIRKIAWRIQANAEGDLTERARRRAMELADDADVHVVGPRGYIVPPEANTRVHGGVTGATVATPRPVTRSTPPTAVLNP